MPSPADLSRQFRAALLQRDAAALQRINAAYGQVLDAILTELGKLLEQRAIAEAAGQATGIGWLYRERRLTTLLDQVAAQMDSFAAALNPQVTADAVQAAQIARQQAAALIRASIGDLHTAAVETLVGSLDDTGPLAQLLGTFGADAAAVVKQALVVGIGTGQAPAVISHGIRGALDATRWRALTIARTETMRAFNNAALQTYQHNSDVVRGWRWLASLGARCCGFCVSMNGTFHQVSESLASHPRCRCTAVPETKTFAELGLPSSIPETQVQVPSGSDWFARQDDATQLTILGPSKYRAYSAGAITLEDLRGFRTDPQWGPVGFERSLTSILGADAQQYLRPEATG